MAFLFCYINIETFSNEIPGNNFKKLHSHMGEITQLL